MRKNIVISMQQAELEQLDRLARELNLTRSAAIRILVGMYYKRAWGLEETRRFLATYGRKVE